MHFTTRARSPLSPFKLLMDEVNGDGGEWVETFKQMTSRSFSEEKTIENFVCAMYGMRHCTSTNVVRTAKLEKQIKPNAKTPHKLKKSRLWLIASLPKSFAKEDPQSSDDRNDVV